MCFFKKKPTPGLIMEERDNGYWCSGIKNFQGKEIVFPEVEKNRPVTGNFIGSNFDAKNMTKMHLSKTIKEYNWYPIKRCPNFVSYSVDKNNPELVAVDGVLYPKKMDSLIDVPCGRSGKFVLPAMTVKEFPLSSPFLGCDKLTEIDLSNLSDQSIVPQCFKLFKDLTSLKKVILPKWMEARNLDPRVYGEWIDKVTFK